MPENGRDGGSRAGGGRPPGRAHLERRLAENPDLSERILRSLLIVLHSRGIVSVDEIHRQARARPLPAEPPPVDHQAESVQVARRWDERERRAIEDAVLDHAGRHLSRAEVDDLVNLTRKRDGAQTIEEIANLSQVSFGLLAERVRAFCDLPRGQSPLPAHESVAARVALIRSLISDQLEFIGVARRWLRIRDFGDLIERIVGPPEGSGLIGGKAGGMVLASRILARVRAEQADAPDLPLRTPESFFVRSDVIERFIQHNGLQHLQDQKYKSPEEIANEFPMVLEVIKNADFPPGIVAQMRRLLQQLGEHPLIVRSSSLLEDRFGTAFAGKYRSVFVRNRGPLESRLDELLGAVAEVYASTFHPDPISYRRRHHLLDYGENMAVLIQKLVGRRAGRHFLPVWSGVAFSRNPYRRNPRIRPEDGLARVVFGLGTRAVDRVASDFPRMIPLGLPALRPEVAAEDILRVSQKEADVIDLDGDGFATVPVERVLAAADGLPGLSLVLSTQEHGFLRPLMGDRLVGPPADAVVTFDRFAQSSPWPGFLRWLLRTLEDAYGTPVDIEFASDGEELHLLQCRPQVVRPEHPPVRVPDDVPPERRLFSADRDVITGEVRDVRYLVLVEPTAYNALPTSERRLRVAQAVRAVNRRLRNERFVLMGPGRWGSKDLRLGVRVGYADIEHTLMLIEIARARDGYVPEVSFGSHFFQDLVESDIRYLALYPDRPGTRFAEDFLHGAPGRLAELAPDFADLAEVVRVIDLPAAANGLLLQVAMDGEGQRALGWLGPGGRG